MSDDKKTFIQADVDRIVGERLARQETTLNEQYKDYDDLKAKAEKYDELEAANATELEREKKRADDAEAERDAAKTAAEDAAKSSRETKRQSAIVAAAATAGAIDPDEVHALLANKNFEVVGEGDVKHAVTIGDDGQVTGAKEAVTAFLEQRKHLVGTTSGPGPGGGGARGGAPTPTPLDQQIAEAESKGDWSTAGQLKAQKLAESAT